MRSTRAAALATAVLTTTLAVVATSSLRATEVKVFQTRSQKAFLEGTLEALSVDAYGVLSLARSAEQVAEIAEPFLLSAAAGPDGWVVGTGNLGRVFSVGDDGTVEQLFELPEPEIFAVWVAGDGTVFAASSPNGKVYRWSGDQAEEFFAPEETYIWALAGLPDGDLLVATGTEGRLYRVGADGESSLYFDSEDVHIRSLLVRPDGTVFAGTAGDGLIVRLDPDGRARTLYDSPAPEIVALADDGAGGVYAAALASEASFVDLSASSDDEEDDKDDGDDESSADVSVEEASSEQTVGSRRSGFSGARSVLLHWTPNSAVRRVSQFESETMYSLLWSGDRLWVGTGLEGKLYSLVGEQLVLEKDLEESQIVALLPSSPGPALATTNAAAIWRLSEEREERGTIVSQVLDAAELSRFGSLSWLGEQPGDSDIRFSLRSGMSALPDRTWSDWWPAPEGDEISLGELDASRYLQWKAELAGDRDGSPTLARVDISYLQVNQRPAISSFTVLDAGKVLVPSNFNPSTQTYEPAHPNRDGIFNRLGEPTGDNARLKTLWKIGYRTLRWNASDPNGDSLRYRLSFRPEKAGDDAWLVMAEDLDKSYYSFDATVLPDGHYRFKLEASDDNENPAGEELSDDEISEPVVIDHGVPGLVSARRDGDAFVVSVADAFSPLREAVYSIDAGVWVEAGVGDGLLDGRSEELRVPVEGSARLVLLRLTDAAFNVVTYNLGNVP